jgi:hypothetical protein
MSGGGDLPARQRGRKAVVADDKWWRAPSIFDGTEAGAAPRIAPMLDTVPAAGRSTSATRSSSAKSWKRIH